MEKLTELDVIEVVELNPSIPSACIGDKGAVLLVFGDPKDPEAYEVECVLDDGSNKWEGTFSPFQLKLVTKYVKNT
jgi:hypothetical protein